MFQKQFFVFTLFLLSYSTWGQLNSYDLDLRSDTIQATWNYQLKQALTEDSAIIHLPLLAYIDKASFLNQQLREFQDPDLHFSPKEDKAYFRINHLLINGVEHPISELKELYAIKVKPSESLEISMDFSFHLPTQKITGNGRGKLNTRIIDLLPRFYKNSSQAHPLSYYYDTHYPLEKFKLNLKLGPDRQLLSNLSQHRIENEVHILEGQARQLQLFLEPTFHKYPLGNGGFLYLPEADQNFFRNFLLAFQESSSFFKTELNDSINQDLSFVFLDEKKGEYQSSKLIALQRPKDWLDLRIDLVQAQAEAKLRYAKNTDGWNQPWLARGLPYFYKYLFVKSRYPQKRWIPFQSPILNGLFGFDAFDFGYQNRFLFLFLQRQGLDQALATPVDSLSRLNYEAISQAKAYLILSHLRAYTGERTFKRSMAQMVQKADSLSTYENFQFGLNYFCNKDLEWFFGPALQSADLYDYQLRDYEYCPTVSTATVYNSGDLALPYALTGFKDGKPIITQWYEGHDKEKTVQLFHDEYDKVVLNAHLIHAEYRQKNNTYYDRLILPRMEPIRFQLYNSFEAAEASQVFYVPSVYYNAYDKLLLGVNLSNRSLLVQKPFEYTLVPEYSTGTGKLAGTASFAYNWVSPKSSFFRQIRLGVYSRYNHYDEDLAFWRLSPSLNLQIRKPYPRSPYIQGIRLRGVILNREVSPDIQDLSTLQTASYSVFNANYRLEYTSLLRPTIFRFHLEAAEQFTKLFADYDQRWMLPNKKWLILRAFAGGFLKNELASNGSKDNFYSLGISGTPDYLFDYYFIGRSDQDGVWSRQFFTTDGGFKSETNAFADEFLVSTNLSIPFYGPFGVFGDLALSEEAFYWDYGVRLAILTDFLELYLPMQNQDRNFYSEANYLSNIRFVLDLKLGNIINRARRGFY